ncbi:18364_t:CDS:2 [Gigaspora rosea]|nr:18364_t:CDS:2 [Gigaspora rosea]
MPNIHPDILYQFLRKNILNTSAEEYLNLLVASDELELLEIAEFAQKRLIKEFSPWLFSNLAKSLNILLSQVGLIKKIKITIHVPYKVKLLLLGSRDVFNVNTFHRLCDFQGPTIIILRTIQGDLIGEYNLVSWDSLTIKINKPDRNKLDYYLEKKSYFSQTSNSFIFSFTDQSNPVLIRIKAERNNEAIWNI